MNENIKAMLLFTIVLIIVGCEKTRESASSRIDASYFIDRDRVTEFTTVYGVRCVKIDAGGIDCDWDDVRNK